MALRVSIGEAQLDLSRLIPEALQGGTYCIKLISRREAVGNNENRRCGSAGTFHLGMWHGGTHVTRRITGRLSLQRKMLVSGRTRSGLAICNIPEAEVVDRPGSEIGAMWGHTGGQIWSSRPGVWVGCLLTREGERCVKFEVGFTRRF